MSIEFGILRVGSTITLEATSRVLLDEEVFQELCPLFQRIEADTGQAVDLYGSATFAGSALSQLIQELRSTEHRDSLSPSGRETIASLLQVSLAAQQQGRPLSYFGL